jgi:hypothetical protein
MGSMNNLNKSSSYLEEIINTVNKTPVVRLYGKIVLAHNRAVPIKYIKG